MKKSKRSSFTLNSLIYAIIAILGGLVWFFKGKADGAAADALLGELKGEDKGLAEKQEANKAKLDQINKELDGFYKEREKLQEKHQSDQERANEWNSKKH